MLIRTRALVATALAVGLTALLPAQGSFAKIELAPGSFSSSPNFFVRFRGQIWFVARSNKLYRSDGTPAGTREVPIRSFATQINAMGTVGSRLLLTTSDGRSGFELWSTDGTVAGTRLVKDIVPGSGSSTPTGYLEVGSRSYFNAKNKELWVTDGTTARTSLVKVIGTRGPITLTELPQNRGHFVFYGVGSLWISDGTPAGTRPLLAMNGGKPEPWRGGLAFLAVGAQGQGLYWTDGTKAGTRLLVNTRYQNGNTLVVSACGRYLLFQSSTRSLMRSDGTRAGTTLIGKPTGGVSYMTRHGAFVYFKGWDATNGFELWRSDGTKAGTTMLADLRPGRFGVEPSLLNGSWDREFATIANHLIFSGDDGKGGGREPWFFTLPTMAWQIGPACGLPTRQARLCSSGTPVLGKTVNLISEHVKTNAFGILLLGAVDSTPTAIGHGCFSYVDVTLPWLAFDAWLQSTGTSHTTRLPIPNDIGLRGAKLAFQTWVLPTNAPGGLELSNGLVTLLGK